MLLANMSVYTDECRFIKLGPHLEISTSNFELVLLKSRIRDSFVRVHVTHLSALPIDFICNVLTVTDSKHLVAY